MAEITGTAPDSVPPEVLATEGVEPVSSEEIREAEEVLGEDLGMAEDVSTSKEEKAEVENELGRLRGLVQGMSLQDLKSGDWFVQLLSVGVATHARQVDAAYFRRKYPHLSPDALAQARIQLASRYAAIAGGLTASAYTGAIAATAGSGGAASPLTVPAAVTSFSLDLAYTTQAQLRLAYDMSVIYSIPVDLSDSEDLWKLTRIAFGIRAGEMASNAALKGMPVVIRPLVKKIFSGSTLKAVRGIPQVGQYLLQRNIVKFSIPGIGIPVSTAVNFWTTKASGEYARGVFRAEAVIIERAGRIAASTVHHPALLRVLWLVAHADGRISEAERLILHHLSIRVNDTDEVRTVLEEQRTAIEIDEKAAWAAVEGLPLADRVVLHEAAEWAASIDGQVKEPAREVLCRLAQFADIDSAATEEPHSDEDGGSLLSRTAGMAQRGVGAAGRFGRGLQAKREARTLAKAEVIQQRRAVDAGDAPRQAVD